jgi:CheY-like chemotaxis protein
LFIETPFVIDNNIPTIYISNDGVKPKTPNHLFKPISETDFIDSLLDTLKENISDTEKELVKILIAEDVIINQTVINGFLNKLGYSDIIFVNNGASAIDKMCEKEFDIVLLDIKMPIMSGTTVIKKLRDHFIYKSTKIPQIKNKKIPYIIALTAYSIGADRAKYLSQGFDNYISKPIDINNLKHVLNSRQKK